jgi:YegS/Rv2252/BmrU family lipid kinase
MYCLIFNPTAGAGRSRKALETVESILKEQGKEYFIKSTEYKGHATELAKDCIGKGYDGIISVGGDGTLLEIAQGLLGTDETLGVIPAGTGNDYRDAIGVSSDPAEALAVILKGYSKRADTGLINNTRTFINLAGTGFDVLVLKNTLKVRKVFTGGIAYILGIVMSLIGFKNIDMDITMDGVKMQRKALLAVVANGTCFGGGLRISPDSKVDDGLFNVVIINRVSKLGILVQLPKLKKGAIDKIPMAEQFTCREITIECAGKQSLDIDGEISGETPVTFTLNPKSLRVFCPRP